MPTSGNPAARYAALAPAARLGVLTDDPNRLHPDLAVALVHESQRMLGRSRSEARSLAHLAIVAASAALDHAETTQRSVLRPILHDTAAEAWAVISESHALDASLEDAWAALATASLLAVHGSGDALLAASLTLAEALIAWASEQHGRALLLLDLAETQYLALEDPRGQAVVEVRRAAILNDLGEKSAALAALQHARALEPDSAAHAIELLLEDLVFERPASPASALRH